MHLLLGWNPCTPSCHIGASLDWEMRQLDIKTMFLHGDLEEEIYMHQPEGQKEPGKEE